MPSDLIHVRGAREHNLKNVDLTIPRDRLVVFTGLSGSGKSSLAFDTIYAEGQRRYVESLSAYARQFLGQMEKPDVDQIDGLSPAISIDQKGTSKNPRSTVATVTEIYDYLRLLYARAGQPHCPLCGRPISRQTVDEVTDQILALPQRLRVMILAPVVVGRKGEHTEVLEGARKAGFVRVRVDGNLYELEESIKLDKNFKHDVEVVVDRAVIDPESRSRLTESVETATRMSQGSVLVVPVAAPGEAAAPDPRKKLKGARDAGDLLFSLAYACPEHGSTGLADPQPRNFSFNSPHGACPECTGLGTQLEVDPDLVLPDRSLSLADGAFANLGRSGAYYNEHAEWIARKHGISLTRPLADLPEEDVDFLLYGTDDFDPKRPGQRNRYGKVRLKRATVEGVVTSLERRYRETESEWVRSEIERLMVTRPCPRCKGARLKPESLAVTVGGRNIAEVCELSVTAAVRFFDELELSERQRTIATQVLKEVRERLTFMVDVGLEYLTLNRVTPTLSGGEAQRIRLATQIGSRLMGVLYVLDEPSIGLHQRDNRKLINTLERLRDLGNTLIVVEHDEETMRHADHLVDIGPGAGEHGGHIVFSGSYDDMVRSPESVTGQYLRGERSIPMPERRRKGSGKKLVLRGARENNLKDLNVTFPLGRLICVTGVSGSGKSTLINDILYRRLAQHFYRAKERPGKHRALSGLEHLDKVIEVDQSPIGRTPRSNPATYTGAFTYMRELFATLPEARDRGYTPGRFSFNVKGGRCEACQGDGMIKIEMNFLPDVYVPCEVCKGRRYNREALEVKFKGHSISDVLDMTVEEGLELFANVPRIHKKLQTLVDVGLGYIRLGQPATTLSGGEAQRVKLSTELSRRDTGMTFYILDEPTTGLHFADIERLLGVLQELVDRGNTVLVIEHNLDVIKAADHIIDLGPEGGDRGGEVVAEGTPEQVAESPRSYTGAFLRPLLKKLELQPA
ncbi:MAG TPA: excinuclease ABC subunit UvrA [Candidatus Dormibacteraeota bacterium]|jgi:excinuclease ABC subunit A|nr:excinuclease ABC subunit UvrA [Candidatus Dormibacteraeota bacterium]